MGAISFVFIQFICLFDGSSNVDEKEVKEIAGVDIRLIKERLIKGYSIEEAFTTLRRTNRDE